MKPDKRTINRINHIYNHRNGGINSERFYRDYSEGYRYSIGKVSSDTDFISVEPEKSNLEQLLRKKHYHNLSYDLEVAFEGAIYSLMRYGKAYIYINAEYELKADDEEHTKRILSSLQIGEIKGVITSKSHTNIEFYGFGPIGNVIKHNYNPSGLLELKLKDLGYSQKYFTKIAKRIDKYDVISSKLIYGKNDGYDFSEHLKKSDIHQFRVTRKLGWIPRADELSQSQYYYRKIQQNKFKSFMLDYVLKCVNEKLKTFLSLDSDGKLVVSYRINNYDELWEKYTSGCITATELASILQ